MENSNLIALLKLDWWEFCFLHVISILVRKRNEFVIFTRNGGELTRDHDFQSSVILLDDQLRNIESMQILTMS